jgi:hypothetical protein
MRRRIVLLLAAIAVMVAVALSGSAFGLVPAGAGCEGIVKAIIAQKANPTGEDETHAELADTVAKAHKCDVGKGS